MPRQSCVQGTQTKCTLSMELEGKIFPKWLKSQRNVKWLLRWYQLIAKIPKMTACIDDIIFQRHQPTGQSLDGKGRIHNNMMSLVDWSVTSANADILLCYNVLLVVSDVCSHWFNSVGYFTWSENMQSNGQLLRVYHTMGDVPKTNGCQLSPAIPTSPSFNNPRLLPHFQTCGDEHCYHDLRY